MSAHIEKTVADLQRHLDSIEEEAADTKRTINSLCKAMGKPAIYADVDKKSTAGTGPIRADQYYGRPLATVAREILESRQAMNLGPATVAELYERMVEGGFVFDSENVENRKRVLRISLAKNTSTFHKLPGGEYGLLEWYPAIKPKKNGKSAATDDEEDSDDDAVDRAVESGVFSDGYETVAAAAGDATPPRKAK